MYTQTVDELLSAEGPFKNYIDGFAVRSQQQEMALAIDECIDAQSLFIAEAGTGTGKTFAYLVPAVHSGKKVVISTGTKNLQDQLFHQDLPLVINALGKSVYAVLLKGRANYICPYRLKQTEFGGRLPPSQQHDLNIIINWLPGSKTGDKAELEEISTDSHIWSKVTSTTDNCLGTECQFVSDCCVLNARKQALQADIIIVNHHLFFADMALKEEGFGEIIPGADVYIFDEAHQIINIAPNYFGYSLSSHRIESFANDLSAQIMEDAPDLSQIEELSAKMLDSVKRFRVALGRNDKRSSWPDENNQQSILSELLALSKRIKSIEDALKPQVSRSTGLERCWQRVSELGFLTEQFLNIDDAQDDISEEVSADSEMISWYETKSQRFSLHKTPMTISKTFREYIDSKPGSWIFTSATLTIKDDFGYFSGRLGIKDAKTLQWYSPFDYARQSIMYIPKNLPDPRDNTYVDAMIEAIIPVVKISKGRTFILVTSYRVLNQLASELENKIDYPLLVQGTMPSDRLIRKFKKLGNAVLLGTSSFWQGVDVKGQSLSCVIIDKLPFAAPNDPKVQATINFLRRHGRNPFMHYQLPEAVINLKQGAGRLIRDPKDTGILMLCDPRLYTKPFGKVFIKSLPQKVITREFTDVEQFTQRINGVENNTLLAEQIE